MSSRGARGRVHRRMVARVRGSRAAGALVAVRLPLGAKAVVAVPPWREVAVTLLRVPLVRRARQRDLPLALVVLLPGPLA